MTDDELADAFEAVSLGRSVSHLEHVRVTWVFVRRYGRGEAEQRMVDVTRRTAESLGAPDRFDEPLTRAWVQAVADAADPGDQSPDDLLSRRPELMRSDLLGLPSWRRT